MSGGTIILGSTLAASVIANAYFLFARRFDTFSRGLKDYLGVSSAGRPDLATHFSPPASGGPEQQKIQSSLNTLVSKLRENFRKTFSVGYHLTKTSDSMKSVSTQLQDMSDKLSSQATQVATAMEEMSSTINEIARNATTVAKAGTSSKEHTDRATQAIADNMKSIELLSENVTSWAETSRALSAATDRIDKIILVINEIAGQTNLLALNAAIEAARAGEQGRGFAVVADEVRKLADKTGSATKEIGDMIKDVKEKADHSLTTMDATLNRVSDNIERSRHAEESLNLIAAEVKETVDMIHRIATASEEQAQVSEDVLKNMEKVSGYASEAKDLATAISGSGESIASFAHSLYSQLCSVKKDGTDCEMEARLRSQSAELCALIELSIKQGRIDAAALFDENYAATGEPEKFRNRANKFFDSDVLPLLKKWSQADKRITYVVAMDKNGYMPTHTNPPRALVRMQDPISLNGARSEVIIGQAFRRPIAAGGELVVDIAAPVIVAGRHWGCLRIGYLPDMVQ